MSNAVPTGYMGADFCDITRGDSVAVGGAGAVRLMPARSAAPLQCAGRVISIDRYPERLALTKQLGAETINYAEIDSVQETICEATGGGPDAVIEAVGMETHSTGVQQVYDRAKQALRM
ncbi:zinc-binding dehydrogenase [Mycobacterium sp. 29Ha]|uniref:zinc-binding dehydrogenase n=1 Tax=Mycobacterium sp. 29Ha TaxID=2939268 RepID=UPI002939854A|nr:zinc-binding dehydrogenase [Mycobacterium sp. 29Ha]